MLLAGHLPVHGSPWIAQYARAAAEASGAPVALVRRRAGSCTVELFGADHAPPIPPPVRSDGDPWIPPALAATIARWIITGETEDDALALAEDPRISAATVLSGANDAAVVAAYRAIKALIGRRADPALAIRLAVAGATAAEAQSMLARVQQACAAFLGRAVALGPEIARLKPAGGVTIAQRAGATAPGALIDLVAAACPACAAAAASPHSAPVRAPGSPARRDPIDHPAPASAAPIAASAASPGASPAAAPPAHAVPAEPTLYRHVAGLVPLAARCPDDPGVELAVDREGVLHVLVALGGTPDDRAVERLVAVRAWAARHIELIAMAASGILPIDARRAPVAHAFTARPKEVRRLFDADIRWHALMPVAADHRTVWCCMELN